MSLAQVFKALFGSSADEAAIDSFVASGVRREPSPSLLANYVPPAAAGVVINNISRPSEDLNAAVDRLVAERAQQMGIPNAPATVGTGPVDNSPIARLNAAIDRQITEASSSTGPLASLRGQIEREGNASHDAAAASEAAGLDAAVDRLVAMRR